MQRGELTGPLALPQLDEAHQERRARIVRRAQPFDVGFLQLALRGHVQADCRDRDARTKHDLRGCPVSADIIFGHQHLKCATHEYDALDLVLDARLDLERQGDVSQRTHRNQRQLPRRSEQGFDDQVGGAAMGRGRRRILRGEHFKLTRAPRLQRIEEGLGSACSQRNIAPAI